MRQEFDEALCRDFPELYVDRRGDERGTCMCWGFECGDGWYELIRQLSEKLTKLIKEFPKEEQSDFRALQVKEKYGTLRFYLTAGTDAIFDAIDEASSSSAKICESCGRPGRIRGEGWLLTRCDGCVNS